jgi:hypothetical protein
MYSHGSAADGHMMAQLYQEFHRVYADRYGTVWSQASGTNRVAGRIPPASQMTLPRSHGTTRNFVAYGGFFSVSRSK